MILLWVYALGLLLGVFVISGFIGWHLAPRPKVKRRRVSVFEETPPLPMAVATPVPANDLVQLPEVEAPKTETPATETPKTETPAEPWAWSDFVEGGMAIGPDRSDRPQRSALADLTPEALAAALKTAGEGVPPYLLPAPQGQADDLKLISGIGAVNENELNRLGIHHYWQMASWQPEHVVWLTSRLHFAPRIVRENWISQAARLAQRAA